MKAYETLEYILKDTNLLSKIDSEPFEIKIRNLYNKIGFIPDSVIKSIIDDNMSEEELMEAMDTYEDLDTLIDEFASIMEDLRNI